MNPFDMGIIVIVGYTIIRGLFRGLVKELAAIVGLVVGFYTAYGFHDEIAGLFLGWMVDPIHAKILSFLILFCCVFLIVFLLGALIRLVMKFALLGIFDRFFGGLFGALKGILMISFAYFLLVAFLPRSETSFLAKSKLMPPIKMVSVKIVRMVPEKTRNSFIQKLNEIKSEWTGTA